MFAVREAVKKSYFLNGRAPEQIIFLIAITPNHFIHKKKNVRKNLGLGMG